MKTIKASKHNYGGSRSRASVRYIVIHYTAGDTDTAENEGVYFSRPHDPKTSAHFFIGRDGTVVKSVALNKIAYAVGGGRQTPKGGSYFRLCTNANSVSIELCANLTKDPSREQIKAVKDTIRYIRKYCKNAKTVIRHFDVNGKICPKRLIDDKKWKQFKKEIGE